MLHTPEICFLCFGGIYGSVIYRQSHLLSFFWFRKVLEIGVLTWSLATALVPLLAGFMPGLILSRILVCKFLQIFYSTASIVSPTKKQKKKKKIQPV